MDTWLHMAAELDRYLEWEDRISPGTGGNAGPREPLPELGPGVRLYEKTRSCMDEVWGGYEQMPSEGKRAWDLVLGVSRGQPGNKEAILKGWAEWLREFW